MRRSLFYASHNARDVLDSYFFPGLRFEKTPLGFWFKGSRSHHHKAMQRGMFEQEEVQVISALLTHAQVFVDIGANVGYFACIAANLGRRVIAIEPSERNLRFLLENLARNEWRDAEVVAAGVGAQVGIATLFGASSTGASLVRNWAGSQTRFKRLVPISTLDVILGHRFLQEQLLIKIDVEGAEYEALAGARATIMRTRKPFWIVEITFDEYHPEGKNPRFFDIFDLFFSAGYAAFVVDGGLISLTRADIEEWVSSGRRRYQGINFLFCDMGMEAKVRQITETGAGVR